VNRARVVIVGAGFAGYHAARTLSAKLGKRVEVVLLNPTDYFLYLPLLPQVAAGILEPRRVTVSLTATLPRVRLVLGEAHAVDLDERRIHYTNPEDGRRELDYDTLLLSVGSVNRLLPIPGVTEHAKRFRGLPEALYLRDHIVRQLELAAESADEDERRARATEERGDRDHADAGP
jgi:NADH dehydrogenase